LTKEEYAAVRANENIFHLPYQICHLSLEEIASGDDKR